MEYFEVNFIGDDTVCRQYGALINENGEKQMSWHLRDARPYKGPKFISVPVSPDGDMPDFSQNVFDVVMASAKAMAILRRFNVNMDVYEFQPETGEQVFAVNVLDVVDCIDMARAKYTLLDEASKAKRWAGRDGDINHMYQLVLRDDVEIQSDLFRLFGWRVSLVVSDRLMREMLEHCRCDVKFEKIPGAAEWDAGFPCLWREFEKWKQSQSQ